ncbi:hypothetical protein FQN53_008274 [Emmonsiellopsis sp. PD_33]|nr:hypothetical protein FQN53_008274 [Emmonsiellopsis sp. PD_33]
MSGRHYGSRGGSERKWGVRSAHSGGHSNGYANGYNSGYNNGYGGGTSGGSASSANAQSVQHGQHGRDAYAGESYATKPSAPQHKDNSPSNSKMAKDGWGDRGTFLKSYGLKMTPEGFEEGKRILDAFREADEGKYRNGNQGDSDNGDRSRGNSGDQGESRDAESNAPYVAYRCSNGDGSTRGERDDDDCYSGDPNVEEYADDGNYGDDGYFDDGADYGDDGGCGDYENSWDY